MLLAAIVAIPGTVLAAAQSAKGEYLSGYYARDGNHSSSSQTAGNNIYIKFFDDRWIAMLYIPQAYPTEVEPPVIEKLFEAARKQVSSSAYLRGTFDQLSEPVTLHFERYGYLQDRLVFECGSLAPCTIKPQQDFLELIKPGVINEHIIRYNFVAGQ